MPRSRPGLTVRRAAVVAAVLALTGAASSCGLVSLAQAAPARGAPALRANARGTTAGWRIVKQVHGGPFGGFSTVISVGRTGGWAFNQGSVPTALAAQRFQPFYLVAGAVPGPAQRGRGRGRRHVAR
jgi:hypothetical protein